MLQFSAWRFLSGPWAENFTGGYGLEWCNRVVKPSAILASNTNSISITRIASYTQRPPQVMGMHFMNPAPLMKLVEIIRGLQTDDAIFESVCRLAERLGKTVSCSRDYPGFVVNRILMPMINEAFYALQEGVASAEHIDTGVKLGTNQPMGPLTLADFIGLDTCLSIMQVLYSGLGDTKYRPCSIRGCRLARSKEWARRVQLPVQPLKLKVEVHRKLFSLASERSLNPCSRNSFK